MNKFKKLGKSISDVFLVAFLIVIIPVMLFVLITSRTGIILGIRSYIVQTGSMEPVLPVGSVVFTVPKPPYIPGQIITFNRGKITVTHRISAIKGEQFETKGDANDNSDPQLVNKSDVIGTDFLTVPYFGKFVMFVKTIPGFLLVIAFPNLIFITFEIWNIKEEYRKEIEKRVMARLSI